MLDLSVPVRTVEGVEIAADESRRHAYWVLPPRPTLAVSNGAPDLELLRFVRNGQLTGGHMRLGAVLAADARLVGRARAFLADEARVDPDQITLGPIPVESASAQVLFLGREATADGMTGIVARPFGTSPAQVTAPHGAAFSIDLTADGVRLMEAALSSGTAPIAVVYRLIVEGLWPAQQMIVRVDWSRVYDHFSSHYKEGNLLMASDVQRISEQLIESRAVSIRAIQGLVADDAGSQGDIGAALLWVQRTIVEEVCEPVMALSREPARASLGTLGEVFGVGSAFAVKKRTQIERATADVDLQRHSVVTRTLTQQAHLADIGNGARVVDAGPDHPFFARMKLNIRTAQPLAESFIDEAVVNFSYGTTREAARLTRSAPDAMFDTWADSAPDRTWSLQPEITFASDAPLDPGTRVLLPAISGQSREVTLDLHALAGLKRIDVEARPDPRLLITRATVRRVRTGEANVEQVLTFAGGASASRAAWFRASRPGDRFEVDTEYLLASGRQVRAGTQAVDTRMVRLPPAFPGALTVHLFAEDEWRDLDRVVVSLQKTADQPAKTFTFDKGGSVLDVNLDMPDPSDRRFRYRVARTWSTGVVEEDDWVETDVPALVVGRVAAHKLVVDVSAVGPELPEAGVRLIEVDLSYIDVTNQVRDIRKAVIGARADRFHWEVGLKDPNRRQYEYRVTIHRTSGTSQTGRWTTTAERLLAIPVTPA